MTSERLKRRDFLAPVFISKSIYNCLFSNCLMLHWRLKRMNFKSESKLNVRVLPYKSREVGINNDNGIQVVNYFTALKCSVQLNLVTTLAVGYVNFPNKCC